MWLDIASEPYRMDRFMRLVPIKRSDLWVIMVSQSVDDGRDGSAWHLEAALVVEQPDWLTMQQIYMATRK